MNQLWEDIFSKSTIFRLAHKILFLRFLGNSYVVIVVKFLICFIPNSFLRPLYELACACLPFYDQRDNLLVWLCEHFNIFSYFIYIVYLLLLSILLDRGSGSQVYKSTIKCNGAEENGSQSSAWYQCEKHDASLLPRDKAVPSNCLQFSSCRL
jgi:hypothetical protein